MILALDVGEKRVGLALSDEAEKTALPLGAYPVAKGQAEKRIIELIQERGIDLIVAGLPLDENNAATPQCVKIQNFCRRLQRRSPLKIQFVDEYCSSHEAQERLHSVNRKGSAARRREVIDAVSASVILQTFLDSRNALKR